MVSIEKCIFCNIDIDVDDEYCDYEFCDHCSIVDCYIVCCYKCLELAEWVYFPGGLYLCKECFSKPIKNLNK